MVNLELVSGCKFEATLTLGPPGDSRPFRILVPFDYSKGYHGSTQVRTGEHPPDGAFQESPLFGTDSRIHRRTQLVT